MARYWRRWERYTNLEPVSVPWGIFSPAGQVGMPALIRKMELDIFHSTNYFLPLLLWKTRMVITIHDLIPLKFPHFTPRAKKTRFNWFFRWILLRCSHRADRVITISLHTRNDLITELGLPAEKITVVYNGIDSKYRVLERERVLRFCQEKLGSTSPFILYVGRFDPYKNVAGLILAFDRFRRDRKDDPRLVLAGHPDPRYPETGEIVRSLGLESRVVFLDGVDEDELIYLYNGARILILPSFYEGFGLPPLESMACGTPVIVSDRGSLPEVIGDAGLFVDPDREESITGAIRTLWESDRLRSELREKGFKRAKDFSWEKTARETLEVYESLAGSPAENKPRSWRGKAVSAAGVKL